MIEDVRAVQKGEEVTGTASRMYILKPSIPGIGSFADLKNFNPESYVVVGGQTGGSFNRSREIKEIGHKDDGGSAKQLPGKKTAEFSMDGMYIAGDEGFKALEDIYEDGDGRAVIYFELAGVRYLSNVIITSLDLDVPYDEAVTYACQAVANGKVERTDVSSENLTLITAKKSK